MFYLLHVSSFRHNDYFSLSSTFKSFPSCSNRCISESRESASRITRIFRLEHFNSFFNHRNSRIEGRLTVGVGHSSLNLMGPHLDTEINNSSSEVLPIPIGEPLSFSTCRDPTIWIFSSSTFLGS
ncbi:uncharacterized protein CANTADRAFT_133260 [Suhomyces tanzawaensis NRRL Y-17324]|uniref:Uncharacterized protein n=1 Tax=Suhomyces tanzawaensis NRRL Y-17324 TaxID=984487 RepID=A0A1E4SRK0_9ASCO|nr:uncharacterized protein CANTADRAFT_133260 [Suhomyces tanzawaensis NRRL Y-17324]ODV82067.1 hypothetical protein CANTADRAFT_133260 [Suhomyces tanzawaensis NRRL Y-17324]